MANIVPSALSNSDIGKQISFTSKNASDDNVYKGTMRGILDYVVAKNYAGGIDLPSYRGAVSQVDGTIGALEELKYFFIAIDKNDPTDPETLKVFAAEFVSGNITVIENNVSIDIRVWGVSATDEAAIISALNSAGYSAKVLEVVT